MIELKIALDLLRRAALAVGEDPRDVEVRLPPETFDRARAELSPAEVLLSTPGVSFRWRDVFVKRQTKGE